jgi:cytochrome c oxidase assembly protein subunit 15
MMKSQSHIWLSRFAKLTCLSTYLLIVVGSLVTTTSSGLAVPDWPLSFGQFFPEMKGGVLFEHGHRMVAGTVGIMMTVLAIWIWLAEDRRWLKMLALGAWFAVLAQAILGGITVLNQLPVAVSVSHAGLAMMFFAMTAFIALATDTSWDVLREKIAKIPPASALTKFTIAAAAVVYIQIMFGAIMRHMGAGMAIPDWPLSYGQIIPPRLDVATIAFNFAHRSWAWVTAAMLVMLFFAVRRHAEREHGLHKWAHILAGLVFVQIVLGGWTVWSIKDYVVTTLHVATGAAIWVTSVAVMIRTLLLRHAQSVAHTAVATKPREVMA